MAVTVLTTSMAAGVNYTHTTDSPSDWPSVPNSTYFFDKTDKLVYYKDSGGTVLSAYTTGGATVLNDLTDVTLNFNPLSGVQDDDGKYMYYDTAAQQFVTSEEVNHGTVIINAKKSTAGTIDKGLPVYLVGFSGDTVTVELAEADVAGKMPVIGFTAETLNDTDSKHIMTFGRLTGVNTTNAVTTLNPNGETWPINTPLYISNTAGGLTKVRPTGASTLIQRVAKVLKVDALGGQLQVFNTFRSAGLPNLTNGNFWLGNANGHPVETTFPTNLVDYTGVPQNNQIAVFTDINTIEGDPNFQWNGGQLTINTGDTTPVELSFNASSGLSILSESFAQMAATTYSDTLYPFVRLTRSRGTYDASTPPQSGDSLGGYEWASLSGTAAWIVARATETHAIGTNGGANISINHKKTGTNSLVERIKLNGDGTITFHNGASSFTFPEARGTAGQVLTDVAGTGTLSWQTPSGGGGGSGVNWIPMFSGGSFGTNQTFYSNWELATAVQSFAEVAFPAGTLNAFKINCSANSANNPTVIDVMRGASVLISVTIPGLTTGVFTATGSVAIANNDLLSIRVAIPAGGPSIALRGGLLSITV